jgi:hypothetical protein
MFKFFVPVLFEPNLAKIATQSKQAPKIYSKFIFWILFLLKLQFLPELLAKN